jgi:hypothetical protein
MYLIIRICIITHAHEQVIFSLRFFWKLKKKYAEEIVIIVIVNLNIFLSSNDAAIQELFINVLNYCEFCKTMYIEINGLQVLVLTVL